MYASCYFTSPNETVNSCDKHVFKIGDDEMLKRFIMLGTEKGTYYVKERELTVQHIECLERLLKDDASKIFNVLKEYKNRVFKKDYMLAVLARLCAEKQCAETRESAYNLMLEVCKIPTHFFMFLELYEKIHRQVNGSTGWNNMHKRYIQKWYLCKDVKKLAYLITKYQNRNGWTHRDVFRLAHIKPIESHDGLFAYIARDTVDKFVDGDVDVREYIMGYEKLKESTDVVEAIDLIRKFGFTREHVPTAMLGSETAIWKELINNLPIIALLRNLNTITSLGVFDGMDCVNKICDKLLNPDYMTAHPLQILISLKTYSSGRGFKGSKTWMPNSRICEALNRGYKLSFRNAPSTGKRFLLALDVSGSMMGSSVCGIQNMTAAEIATAMAMILAEREPLCDIMGFAETFRHLDIDPERSLEDNMNTIYSTSFGNTDISLPFTWALNNNKSYDCIIVFTDNETNCNRIRPVDALQKYREKMALPYSKLIVIATSAMPFSIADPNDNSMLDIVGFDADTPVVISEFVKS